MLRYLALVFANPLGRSETEAHIAAATGLGTPCAAGPVTIFVDRRDRLLSLPEGRGFVAGTVFRRHGPPRAIDAFDPVEGFGISDGHGADLLARYWGAYVAMLHRDDGVTILRDPSGALPCYYGRVEGLVLLASDVSLLVTTGLIARRVDWGSLPRHLYARDIPWRKTAIENVSELLAGTALTLCPDGREQLTERWSPWDHVAPDRSVDEPEPAERLKRVVRSCVLSWSSCQQHILLGVSGGLDSSIVAVNLVRPGLDLACLTLVTEDPQGDERIYARMIASVIGSDLIETWFDLDAVRIGRSASAHLPRPSGWTHDQAYQAAVVDAARERRSDVFVTGSGGDNIFYNSSSARPIIDRYLVEGLGAGLMRTIGDVCRITGCSLVQAVREAYRVWRTSRRTYRWQADTAFLHPDIVRAQEELGIDHSWLRSPPTALPGKAAQIAMLLRMQCHHDGYDRSLYLPTIHPLVSQPIIEHCLGISSWTMCEGGVNRSLARRAFRRDLPTTLLERRTKGGPDAFAIKMIAHNLAEIRDHLLGGLLADHDLLDLRALDAVLTPQRVAQGNDYVRLLSLIDTESWVRTWSGTSGLTGG